MAKRTRVTKTVNGKVTFLDKKTPKEKALTRYVNYIAKHKKTLSPITTVCHCANEEAIDIAIEETAKEIFKEFPSLPKCSEHPQGDGLVCGWCNKNRRKEIKFILKLKKKWCKK